MDNAEITRSNRDLFVENILRVPCAAKMTNNECLSKACLKKKKRNIIKYIKKS